MKKNVVDAVNEQIRAEFASAYLYLAMAADFEDRGLSGFSHWLRAQWREEEEHAMKFFDFLLDRGQRVELRGLDEPGTEFGSALEAFKQVLEHEQDITRRIYELFELARNEKDYPLETFLHWFINEQVEEESSAQAIVDRLEIIGDSRAELFILDRDLLNRNRS